MDAADKLEPLFSGIGLAGDAIGLIPGLQPVGLVLNIPNLLIDGYQFIRDSDNLIQGKGNWKDVGVDAFELVGGSLGAKGINYANKARLATNIDKNVARLTEQGYQARKGQLNMLMRKGMTKEEAETYIRQKAYNKAINDPSIVNMRKKAVQQQNKLNQFLPSIIRSPQNIYHAKDLELNNIVKDFINIF